MRHELCEITIRYYIDIIDWKSLYHLLEYTPIAQTIPHPESGWVWSGLVGYTLGAPRLYPGV